MSRYDRPAIYAKTDGHCAYCGTPIELKDMQVDHVIPQMLYEAEWHARQVEGRSLPRNMDDELNLLPACRSCNGYKDTFSVETFREQIALLNSRIKKRVSIARISERYGLLEYRDKPVVFYFEQLGIQTTEGGRL